MRESAIQPGVKSAMRTLDLIEYVVAHPDGVAAQQISDALAIPMSSLSYLLATVVERSYLRRDGRRYLAGDGLDRLRRPRATYSLEEEAAPLLRGLKQQFNETSSLFLPVDHAMQVAITETSSQSLRYSMQVGALTPLHCVAAGKALLATYSPGQIDEYFQHASFERFTPQTICDRSELIEGLREIAKTGIGRTREELTVGISGLGVAVLRGGQAVGAIGVALPSIRLTPLLDQQIADALRGAADTLASD